MALKGAVEVTRLTVGSRCIAADGDSAEKAIWPHLRSWHRMASDTDVVLRGATGMGRLADAQEANRHRVWTWHGEHPLLAPANSRSRPIGNTRFTKLTSAKLPFARAAWTYGL